MKKIIIMILILLSLPVMGFAAAAINFNKVSQGTDRSTERDLKPRWHQPDFSYDNSQAKYGVVEHGAPDEAIVYIDFDVPSGCDQVFFRNLKEPNADAVALTHTCGKNVRQIGQPYMYDKVAPSWGPRFAHVMAPTGGVDTVNIVPCASSHFYQQTLSNGTEVCFAFATTPDTDVEETWSVFYSYRDKPAAQDPNLTPEECDEGVGCSIGMVLINGGTVSNLELTKQDIIDFQNSFYTSHSMYPEFQITYPNLAAGEYDRDVTFNFGLRRTSEELNALAFTRYHNRFQDLKQNPYFLDMVYGQLLPSYHGRVILSKGMMQFFTGNKTYRLSGQCQQDPLLQSNRFNSQTPSWDAWGMNLVFSTRDTTKPDNSYQVATVNLFESPIMGLMGGAQGTPFDSCAEYTYNTAKLAGVFNPYSLTSTSSLEIWTDDQTVDHEYPSFSQYGFAELGDYINPGMGLQPGVIYQRTKLNDPENLYELGGFRLSNAMNFQNLKFFFNYVFAYNKNEPGNKGYPATEVIFDNATYSAPHNIDVDPSYGSTIRRHPVWATPKYNIVRKLIPAGGSVNVLEEVTNKGWIAYERLNQFGYWEIFGEQIDLPGLAFELEDLNLNLTGLTPVQIQKLRDQLEQAFIGSANMAGVALTGSLKVSSHAYKYGVFTISDSNQVTRQYEVVVPDAQFGTGASIVDSMKTQPAFIAKLADVVFRNQVYPGAVTIYVKGQLGLENNLIGMEMTQPDGTVVKFIASAYSNLHREYQWTASCSHHYQWPEFNNAHMNTSLGTNQTFDPIAIASLLETATRPLATANPWPQDLAAGQIVDASAAFDRNNPYAQITGSDNRLVSIGDISNLAVDEASTAIYDKCEVTPPPVSNNQNYDFSCKSGESLYLGTKNNPGNAWLYSVDSTSLNIRKRLLYAGNFSDALATDKDGIVYALRIDSGTNTFHLVVLEPDATYTDYGDTEIEISHNITAMEVGYDPITQTQKLYIFDESSDSFYYVDPTTGSAKAEVLGTYAAQVAPDDLSSGDIVVFGRYLYFFNKNGFVYSIDLTDPIYPIALKTNALASQVSTGRNLSGVIVNAANGKAYIIYVNDVVASFDKATGTVTTEIDKSSGSNQNFDGDGASCPILKPVRINTDPQDPPPASCTPVRRTLGLYASLSDDSDGDQVADACDTCPMDEYLMSEYPYHDASGNGYCNEDIPTECLCCCTDCGDTTVNEGDTIINEGDTIINVELPDWWNDVDNTTPPIESVGGGGISTPEQPVQGEIIPGIADESGCTAANGIWEPTISDILNQGDENLDKNEVELAVNEQAGVCRGASLGFAGAGCACDISKTAGSQNQWPLILMALVLVLTPQFYLRKRRD